MLRFKKHRGCVFSQPSTLYTNAIAPIPLVPFLLSLRLPASAFSRSSFSQPSFSQPSFSILILPILFFSALIPPFPVPSFSNLVSPISRTFLLQPRPPFPVPSFSHTPFFLTLQHLSCILYSPLVPLYGTRSAERNKVKNFNACSTQRNIFHWAERRETRQCCWKWPTIGRNCLQLREKHGDTRRITL